MFWIWICAASKCGRIEKTAEISGGRCWRRFSSAAWYSCRRRLADVLTFLVLLRRRRRRRRAISPLSPVPNPIPPSLTPHCRDQTVLSSSSSCQRGLGNVHNPTIVVNKHAIVRTSIMVCQASAGEIGQGHTFFSSRFLMVFFMGSNSSLACCAGCIIRSSTALTSTRRSLRRDSYSS